jgi:hypothetical protein
MAKERIEETGQTKSTAKNRTYHLETTAPAPVRYALSDH